MTDHQFVAAFRRRLILRQYMRRSPAKQFGIGFGAGVVFALLALLI